VTLPYSTKYYQLLNSQNISLSTVGQKYKFKNHAGSEHARGIVAYKVSKRKMHDELNTL